MPAKHHFALVYTLTNVTKPTVFSDLRGLCRRVHKMRGRSKIQLADHTLRFLDDQPEGRRCVAIYKLSDSGAPERFIAWAWLDGGDWRQLQRALYAAQPNTEAYAEAA